MHDRFQTFLVEPVCLVLACAPDPRRIRGFALVSSRVRSAQSTPKMVAARPRTWALFSEPAISTVVRAQHCSQKPREKPWRGQAVPPLRLSTGAKRIIQFPRPGPVAFPLLRARTFVSGRAIRRAFPAHPGRVSLEISGTDVVVPSVGVRVGCNSVRRKSGGAVGL